MLKGIHGSIGIQQSKLVQLCKSHSLEVLAVQTISGLSLKMFEISRIKITSTLPRHWNKLAQAIQILHALWKLRRGTIDFASDIISTSTGAIPVITCLSLGILRTIWFFERSSHRKLQPKHEAHEKPQSQSKSLYSNLTSDYLNAESNTFVQLLYSGDGT